MASAEEGRDAREPPETFGFNLGPGFGFVVYQIRVGDRYLRRSEISPAR